MKTRYIIFVLLVGGALCQAQPAPAGATQVAESQALVQGLIAEEGEGNLESAIQSYQKVIERFDQQRPSAANALFRVAEAYRKLGRIEEAKALYSRVVREFADQSELARLSSQFLFGSNVVHLGRTVNVARSSANVPQGTFQTWLQQLVERAPSGATATDAYPYRSVQVYEGKTQEQRDLENQMDRARVSAINAQQQLEELTTLYHAVRDAKPEALPARAAVDPRYQELKKVYQNNLLSGRDDMAVQEIKRMQTWVEKILLPELKSELDFAGRRLQDSQRLGEVAQQMLEVYKGKQAQERAHADEMIKAIREKLRRIEGAKELWALENKKGAGDVPPESAVAQFLPGRVIKPIAGEVYSINPIGVAPTASLTSDRSGISAGTVITLPPHSGR